GRLDARHRPEDLELQAVGILRVEGQARAVIRLADERARLEQPPPRARKIGQLVDLPRRVIHPRGALVGRGDARLLEEAEMMIVRRAGDLEERRVRVPVLHLEAEDVAVEPHAALHVGHPQDDVLQPPQPEPAHLGYSMLTVMATHAMSVSLSGTRRPPFTARTVISPCGSSFFT